MTSRLIYRFLLRLHPACFRKQYEEEMLWIFDESIESRGMAPLLIDASVSLIRQWALRSGYWRRGVRPGLRADGTVMLASELRRRAEALHRMAWRLNLLWLVGLILVFRLLPGSLSANPFFFGSIAYAFGQYFRNREGRVNNRLEYTELSLSQDPRNIYRTQIERKRDGLRIWTGGTSRGLGASGILILLVFLGSLLLLRPLIWHSWTLPHGVYPASILEYFIGLACLALLWLFVRRVNERAAQAYQVEIDAMDVPSAYQGGRLE